MLRWSVRNVIPAFFAKLWQMANRPPTHQQPLTLNPLYFNFYLRNWLLFRALVVFNLWLFISQIHSPGCEQSGADTAGVEEGDCWGDLWRDRLRGQPMLWQSSGNWNSVCIDWCPCFLISTYFKTQMNFHDFLSFFLYLFFKIKLLIDIAYHA